MPLITILPHDKPDFGSGMQEPNAGLLLERTGNFNLHGVYTNPLLPKCGNKRWEKIQSNLVIGGESNRGFIGYADDQDKERQQAKKSIIQRPRA